MMPGSFRQGTLDVFHVVLIYDLLNLVECQR